MRTLLALLFIVSATSTQAADDPYEELAAALFSNMAVNYLCRDALGGMARYQAARTIAVDTLSQHIDRNKAVQMVAKMDERFRNDPRAKNPNADPNKCLEASNEALFRVEKAKAALFE